MRKWDLTEPRERPQGGCVSLLTIGPHVGVFLISCINFNSNHYLHLNIYIYLDLDSEPHPDLQDYAQR